MWRGLGAKGARVLFETHKKEGAQAFAFWTATAASIDHFLNEDNGSKWTSAQVRELGKSAQETVQRVRKAIAEAPSGPIDGGY